MNQPVAFPADPELHERAKNPGESVYDYYSHSGREKIVEYRQLCELWLTTYPEPHLASFLSRFSSKRSNQHQSAYFELFLHEWLRHLCPALEIEATMAGSKKRADFLLNFDNNISVAIEALHIAREPDNPNLDWINHYVEQIISEDFGLSFGNCEGNLAEKPRKRHVQSWAREVLCQYTWDEATAQLLKTEGHSLPVRPLTLGDWSAEASVMPRDPQNRKARSCLMQLAGSGIREYNRPMHVRKKIEKKIRDKVTPDQTVPFVLAVNVEDWLARPGKEELQILYGFQHTIRIFLTKSNAGRAPSRSVGAFTAEGGNGVWSKLNNNRQYKRCNAIWFFHQLGGPLAHGIRQEMYLNPFVDHSVELRFLQQFSQAEQAMPQSFQ